MAEKAKSKDAILSRMMKRKRGATTDEMAAETGWQAHSLRSWISRARKGGTAIERIERKNGESAYIMG